MSRPNPLSPHLPSISRLLAWRKAKERKLLRWEWNIFIYYIFVWLISLLPSFVYYIAMLGKRASEAGLPLPLTAKEFVSWFCQSGTVLWLLTRLRERAKFLVGHMFASGAFRQIKMWTACHVSLSLGKNCVYRSPFSLNDGRERQPIYFQENKKLSNKQLALPFSLSRIIRNSCPISNTE